MIQSFKRLTAAVLRLGLTRRQCIGFLAAGWGIFFGLPLPVRSSRAMSARRPIVKQFLSEELTYNIGFWLFSRCGEAKTSFLGTESNGLYRASIEGRTVGFIDWLVGKYRYAYISYLEVSPDEDRLRPLTFQLIKRHLGRESSRTVVFDYPGKEIIYSRVGFDGKSSKERKAMQTGAVYEDYLTLFFNFRHGCYGSLEQGKTYHLPLHVQKGVESLALWIASAQETKKQLERESDRKDKHFFVQFRVSGEDVSSDTGAVEVWLSKNGVPVKGTIKDVIFLGDLWGELMHRKGKDP